MDVSPIFTVKKHELAFNFPAGTSRGVLSTKKLWLITLSAEGKQGIGECSIIEGLSPEYTNDVQYEGKLSEVIHVLNQASLSEAELLDSLDLLIPDLLYFPSIRFGVECALRSWLAPSHGLFFDNALAYRSCMGKALCSSQLLILPKKLLAPVERVTGLYLL
jgi:hypothetical protein